MNTFVAYLYVVLGVFVAVIFPILKAMITPSARTEGLPPWVAKYAKILAFSLVTGVIVLAIYLSANKDALKTVQWFTLFLAGFAWESTIEKFTNKP